MLSAPIKRVNPEVFYVQGASLGIERRELEELKQEAAHNARRRIRICAHLHPEDFLQEMLIVMCEDSYLRPHRRLDQAKSFHVIEGWVDIVLFDEEGGIREVVGMGDWASGRVVYYRMLEQPLYMAFVVQTPFLVFHETVSGPFEAGRYLYAPWAPDGSDPRAAVAYLQELRSKIRQDARS